MTKCKSVATDKNTKEVKTVGKGAQNKVETKKAQSLSYEDICEVIKEVKEEFEEKEKRATEKEKGELANKTVSVLAFTGMSLGEFEVVKETKKEVTVVTKKGKEMVFDKKTGYQTNFKKKAFRNKIVVE